MYDSIMYDVDDPVATITLNRPDVLNAWTPDMDRQVRDAAERAVADRRVVAIVITGAGRGFCAGADMSLLEELSSGARTEESEDAMWWTDPDGEFGGRFTYLMALDKPVLAAVNGPVAGMAVPLTLCCDLRVGTPASLFMTAFSQRGLIAEWGLSWLLPRLVGPAAALDLLFTSRRVDGDEAHQLGLLSHLVDADDLLPFCRRYAEQLAATASPASLAVIKRQVYAQLHVGLGAAERDSQRRMVESFGRPDFAEGVRSFTEHRAPRFDRLGQ